jgi:SAM-dependent methyltransferase
MESNWQDMFEANKRLWNEKTTVHVDSDFYANDAFKKGASSLNPPEIEALGNISGKKVLHLQCHFGQDTISLARMGAEATGADLSDEAVRQANALAKELQADARFICSNVLTLSEVLADSFDIVFTSYGTIGWLPDLDIWAGQIDHFLKPGGKFIIVDFHPFIWTLDDRFQQFHYPYFNREVIEEDTEGTYTDPKSEIGGKSYSWNHPLSDVFGSLSSRGLTLSSFKEYDFSSYNCFPDLEEIGPKQFRFKHHGDRIPYMYCMVWSKP